MINKLLFSFALMIMCSSSLSAQDNSNAASFKKMQWLLGEWEGEWKGAPFYERWRVLDSTHLHQVNYRVEKGDTIVNAESVIMLAGGEIRYEGSDGYTFSLASVNDTAMVFANSAYNERLTFRLLPNGRWFAEMAGPKRKTTHYLRRKIAK